MKELIISSGAIIALIYLGYEIGRYSVLSVLKKIDKKPGMPQYKDPPKPPVRRRSFPRDKVNS